MKIILCLMITILMLGCEKSKNIPPENIKIKSIHTSFNYTVADVVKDFIYDDQGRLIEIRESTDEWTGSTYYDYKDTVIYMEIPTRLPRTDKLYINEDGLVVRVNDGDFLKTYLYDEDGFLELESSPPSPSTSLRATEGRCSRQMMLRLIY